MNRFLFVIMLIVLSFLGWSQTTPVSYFRNMRWPPYVKTSTYVFDLEFAFPPGGNMTLDVRLSNLTYERTLVMAVNVQDAMLVQFPVIIYPYILDTSGSFMLYFRAYRTSFESTLQVRVYERESKFYTIENDLTSIGSNKPTAEVNALGVITYRHESITLNGFKNLIVERYFYAMHFRYWTFINRHAWKKPWMIQAQLRLLTVHAAFILIDSSQSINKRLMLGFQTASDTASSQLLVPLYVDPQTYFPSSNSQEGYLPTQSLFFPLNSFEGLKSIHFRMDIVIQLIHQYTLSYTFTYETLQPLLGPCEIARYCVAIR